MRNARAINRSRGRFSCAGEYIATGDYSELHKERPHSVAAPLEPVPSEVEGGAS